MRFALLAAPIMLLIGCAAAALEPLPQDPGPRTDTTPRLDGAPVPIIHAEVDSSKLMIRIPSTGCTKEADFLPRTRRSDMEGGGVQLMLTRVSADACPGRSAGTKLLEYWLHDIGIRPGDKIHILNPFVPGAASWPEPAGGLRFLVEPRTAAPGAMVTLLLQNNFPHEVGYNLCDSAIERRTESGWVNVPQDGMCTRELRGVAARKEATYKRQLPSSLTRGEYRFRIGVERPLNRGVPGLDPIFSESFYVRP